MPFLIRPNCRFPFQRPVTHNTGPFQGQSTVWILSWTGWRLSDDIPMRPCESLSVTVTLPNEERIVAPGAVVRCSRGQEFAVKHLLLETHIQTRLQHFVKRLLQGPTGIVL
jgi:PilZ domain